MRTTRRVALFAALTATSLMAVAGQAEDSVDKAFAAWNGAFNKGDARTVASLYSPDAVLLPATHEVTTGSGIETFFAGLIAGKVSSHTLEPVKIMRSGDSLIVASKWSATAQDEKGAKKSVGGLATHVLEKQSDGSYKVKLHTFN